ncbi:hypothetical protein C9J12_29430 [Photobacterium frigidiphilum]|uniref:Uncharacterized protein n=1 Tax=Photobacterium frigidiphilum TaxID=264736 RepID=A0A2T3J5U5_9GAMM|nr:hypothetical protein [Photobacterium frigidiphilum]PSU41776.1 hypothetical protein C9J12_29430 [Photobacterium frigidiphilum]
MTDHCDTLLSHAIENTVERLFDRHDVEMLITFIRILRPLGFGLVNWRDAQESLNHTLRAELEKKVASRIKRCIDHSLKNNLTLEEAHYIAETLIGSAYYLPENLKPTRNICSVPDLLNALLPQGVNQFNALIDKASEQ